MSLLVLMGKSCSGKDTIANELVNKHGYENFVSYTTRPMRDGEVQDQTYHLFQRMNSLANNDGFSLNIENIFLQVAYGTTAQQKKIMKRTLKWYQF